MLPEDVFEEFKKAFNERDFARAAKILSVPNILLVGSSKVPVPNHAAMEGLLRTYHSNLLVETFERMEYEIEYLSDVENGKCQAFLSWVNYNEQGNEINRYDTCYILECTASGRWHAINVETLEPVTKRLIQGFPKVSQA